jgi:hypothetical protein
MPTLQWLTRDHDLAAANEFLIASLRKCLISARATTKRRTCSSKATTWMH